MFELFDNSEHTTASKKKTGEGVFIAIRNSIEYHVVQIPIISLAETFAAYIEFNKMTITLLNVYIPPYERAIAYENLTDNIIQIMDTWPSDNFIVAGDFNPNFFSWKQDEDIIDTLYPLCIANSNDSEALLSLIPENSLQQINHIPNPGERYLDLVFCTETDSIDIRAVLNFITGTIPRS